MKTEQDIIVATEDRGGLRLFDKQCVDCGSEYRGTHNQRYCKTCVPDNNARARMVSYNVTQPMFEAMYFDQDGTCLICTKREAVCVDHCHTTGNVRGLLCNGCNFGLGFYEKYADQMRDYMKGDLL